MKCSTSHDILLFPLVKREGRFAYTQEGNVVAYEGGRSGTFKL
jgi:hypothetical protein